MTTADFTANRWQVATVDLKNMSLIRWTISCQAHDIHCNDFEIQILEGNIFKARC